MNTILQAVTWYALTTAERLWTADNKQSIFIRAFQVDEEKVPCRICSFKFTTTGEDLSLKVKPTLASLKSDWKKMRRVTTDRDKIMYGSETDTAGQLRNLRKWALPTWQRSTALFSRRHRAEKLFSLVIEEVMGTVTWRYVFNHGRSQHFMEEAASEYDDAVEYTGEMAE